MTYGEQLIVQSFRRFHESIAISESASNVALPRKDGSTNTQEHTVLLNPGKRPFIGISKALHITPKR